MPPSALPGPISQALPAPLGSGVQINGELISGGKGINRLSPTPAFLSGSQARGKGVFEKSAGKLLPSEGPGGPARNDTGQGFCYKGQRTLKNPPLSWGAQLGCRKPRVSVLPHFFLPGGPYSSSESKRALRPPSPPDEEPLIKSTSLLHSSHGETQAQPWELLAQDHTANCDKTTKCLLPPQNYLVMVTALAQGLWEHRETEDTHLCLLS